MPELPEVQTTVNGIQKHLLGLQIVNVWTDYKSRFHTGKDNIKDPAFFRLFKKAVKGSKIMSAERKGKNVLINLSGHKTVIVHMKMTGHLMYGQYQKIKKGWRAKEEGPLRDDPLNRFVHLVLSLSDGKHLVLADMRKFAKVTFGDTKDIHRSAHLLRHGPEPLDPDFDSLRLKERLFKKPDQPIKKVLMDPEIISGIGNIYSDEILWLSGIHPLERVRDVPQDRWRIIWKAMRETLKKGIALGGDSMSDYRNLLGEKGGFQKKHNAYRKTGEKCAKPGCKGRIVRIKVGGRSAHFCDTHQKLVGK